MKCCGKELPNGTPYVLIRYWCGECNTEHLVDSLELTEYIGRLHKEAVTGEKLPDLL